MRQNYTKEEIDFLRSLNGSELELVLAELTPEESSTVRSLLGSPKEPQPVNPPVEVFRTRAEVAEHFGVNVRTVAEWQKDKTFPGVPGAPGIRAGYYPKEEIEKWLAERTTVSDASSEINQQLKLEKLQKLQLENSEAAGRLIDRVAVEQWVARKAALARQRLSTLEPILMAAVPADVDDRVRETLAADIRRIIDLALFELASDYGSDSEDE